jgi:hypothetical protein
MHRRFSRPRRFARGRYLKKRSFWSGFPAGCSSLPLTDQVTLPLRHSSLGLSRTIPALGRAAYLAASAAAHIVMRSGPEAFHPSDGSSGEVLRPQWEALHSESRDFWKPS